MSTVAVMSSGADLSGLVDPICDTQVDASSPHRCVHGGALFFFCSDACRTRFAEDPSRWAVSAVLGGVRSRPPVLPRGPVAQEAPVVAKLACGDDSDETVTDRSASYDTHPVTGVGADESREPQRVDHRGVDLELDIPQATARTPLTEPTGQFPRPAWLPGAHVDLDIGAGHPATPVFPPPGGPAPEGEPRRMFSPLKAWRERHSATACCRELLKLHQAIAESHPGLTRMALYRQVVMARTGEDTATADSILRLAQESFASWPVNRELNFRDVVHYLAVSEFLASHPGSDWVHADMRRIVQSSIPHGL